jgi:hypothetical protein
MNATQKRRHQLVTAAGLLKSLGMTHDQVLAEAHTLAPAAKAKAEPKATPDWIVAKARNSEARKALAKALRDAGLGHEIADPKLWAKHKKAAGIK